MTTRVANAIAAVPLAIALCVAQNFASISGAKVAAIQLDLSFVTDAALANTQLVSGLSSPVAKGRQTRECRILRICD